MDYAVMVRLAAPAEQVPLDELQKAGAGSLLSEILARVGGMEPDTEVDDEDPTDSVELDDYFVGTQKTQSSNSSWKPSR